MKKTIAILLTLLCILSAFPFALAAGQTSVIGKTVTAEPGTTVRLPVEIGHNQGFCYLKLNFSYDADALELIEVTNGTILTDSFTPTAKSLSWDAEADGVGTGTLCTFTFAVKADADGTYPITFKIVNCFNYNEETVAVSVTDGAIIVTAPHTHSWDTGVITTLATCAAEGVKTFTCTECGQTKTETINKDASNHTGGTEVRNATPATCGKDGYTGDTYCLGCGALLTKGETIPATGEHTWNNGEVTTPATCAAEGVRTFTCTLCKETKTESIDKDADNHTGGKAIEDIAPVTCGRDGYTGDIYCLGCGALLTKGETIPATGEHVWNPGEVTTPATCAAEGKKTYICTICNETKTEVIAKDTNQHTETETKDAAPATCGKDGYTGDTYCLGCGALLTKGETIPATGEHVWNPGEVTTPATCAAEGERTLTCAVCGKNRTETIEKDAGNHVDGAEVKGAAPATCGRDGYTGDTYCKGCGEILSIGETIPATGEHVWDNGEVTTPATCTAEGTKTFSCTECGQTKTETLNKDTGNHTGGTEVKGAAPATCGRDGYTGDTYCKGCGEILSIGETIPATGEHTFGAWTVTKEATTAAAGEKERVCTVCGTKETATIPQLQEPDFLPGDVNLDGKVTAADARLALRKAVGLEAYAEGSVQFRASDVNHDGKITAADARLILRAAVGLETLS